MGMRKHLIIGCGPAALAAVQAIRNVSSEDEIKLVTKENQLPYSPAVLPYLISKEVQESAFFAKGENILKTMNAVLEKGKEVVELLPGQNAVIYSDGTEERYDKLLIATGANASIPSIKGLESGNFFNYRTFGDYQRIEKVLKQKKEVAIYGAGLVAMELAEKLREAGHSVTIIARSTLLRKYYSPKITALLENTLEKHGVRIIGSSLEAVQKEQGKYRMFLSDGDSIVADLLVVVTGVSPAALGSNFIPVIDGGLQAGKYMETNLPDVFVAGDVASAPSFFEGKCGVNPILPEAIEQGKIAGANMAGQETVYRGWLSSNLLRCFDQYMFNVGITGVTEGNNIEIIEKNEDNEYLQLFLKNEFLIGIEGLNVPEVNPGVFRYLIVNKVPLLKYKQILLDKPVETANWLMLQHRRDNTKAFMV